MQGFQAPRPASGLGKAALLPRSVAHPEMGLDRHGKPWQPGLVQVICWLNHLVCHIHMK